ncbi:RluA family pseudouridine synthase [Pelagibacteraceae bacterium]|nr:RluA family pseudouridine synthase [Pelagibacteraceae bacterium]
MIKNIKILNNLNQRLDKYLKNKFTSLTQGFIEKNIRKKNILINNSTTKANYLVKINDDLKILNFHEKLYKNKIIYKKNIKISKETLDEFKRSIKFENNDFIVLNKWSQIATQGGSKINISIDDIIKHINSQYRLVHRLDKETSGLLLIAKNLNYAKKFSNLFIQKQISKHYIALCDGNPKNNYSQVKLEIKNKKLKIENTITNYKLVNKNRGISSILFNPQTGKTHQLRIVSKNLGCPIVGDNKYNIHSKYTKENLMLHAFALKFKINNKNFEFISKLPDYFTSFIKKNNLKISKDLKEYLNSF